MAIELINRVTLGGLLADARQYEDPGLGLCGICARVMTVDCLTRGRPDAGAVSFVTVLFPQENHLAERLEVAADIVGLTVLAPWPAGGLPYRFYGDGCLDVLIGGRLVSSGIYGPRPPETLVVVDTVLFRGLSTRVRKLLAQVGR
jgi:hypothetical protein